MSGVFELFAHEYGLDYNHVLDNWTLETILLHLDKMRERYEGQERALKTPTAHEANGSFADNIPFFTAHNFNVKRIKRGGD